MWDFDQVGLSIRPIAEEPELARFLSGVVLNGWGTLDANKSILSRYPMRALPLLEWSMSGSTTEFFSALRTSGSAKGFFIDYSVETGVPHTFWECDLTPDAAEMIDEQDLFSCSIIFADNNFLSILASCFSDLTILCMTPELFSTYLSNHPINTTLWASDKPVWSDNFEGALQGAFQRLEDWDKRMGHQSSALIADFDWQLSAPYGANGS